MNDIGKHLKQAWQALSVADLGETIDPAVRAARLQGAPAADADLPELPAAREPARLIVLAARQRLLPPALDYVREAAPRLSAAIALLAPSALLGASAGLAAELCAGGTALAVYAIDGNFEAGLRRFLRRHPQAIFVVLADGAAPAGNVPLLPIPVVLVAESSGRRAGGRS